ncbi:MAG: glycosyltransferase family 2 protein [Phycisphaerae bacterium]|jgi:dolichyl-phosphate beta-glucosyltransferase
MDPRQPPPKPDSSHSGPAPGSEGRPALSVVIPAYNEAGRIGPTLTRLREYFAARALPAEIIVVDDGSRDDTAGVVTRAQSGPPPIVLLHNDRNRGKGYSVRRGVQQARGDAVLLCDADLSTPIEELEKLEQALAAGCDVAIGSRDLPDSRLDPPQPLLRRWLARAFRTMRRQLLLPDVRDTQCGFKLFRGPAAADIFARQTVDGWLFDCEVLGLAERLGYRLGEVGIIWRNHPDSRVNASREMLTALPALLAICRRLRHVKR